MLFSSEVNLLKCFSVCIYMLSLELNYQMGLREGFNTQHLCACPKTVLGFRGFFVCCHFSER